MKQMLLFLALFIVAKTHGQSKNDDKSEELPYQQRIVKVKPTIMVFPFFKSTQNIKNLIENDENNRLVIAKVKELFDSRGYSTVNFLSKFRNLQINEVLTEETQTDLKTQIIQSSGADISVEVEYQYNPSETGNEVKIILNSYESSTSSSLSNKVGFSGKFYSDDIGKLSNRAIATIGEDFLNTMQLKFDDIVENGRYMSIELGFSEESDLSMSNEIGDNAIPLSDILEEWIELNAKSYHILGVTSKKILFDVVRVPRLDKNGNVLSTSKYSYELFKFCKSLNLKATPLEKFKPTRLVKGNTIFITLN